MRAVEGITNAEIVTFGRTDKSDYYVTELNEEDTVCEDFTVMYKGERVCRVSLRVPGEHNMMNGFGAPLRHMAGRGRRAHQKGA